MGIFKKYPLKVLFIFSLFFLMNVNTSLANETGSITYEGSISSSEFHSYLFSNNKEGVVTIEMSEGTNILFSLVNINNQELSYQSGDTLPIGEYEITFSLFESSSPIYQVHLFGDISIEGETTLPELNITSPATVQKVLPEGEFTTLYSGSSNASVLNLKLNQNVPFALSNNFSEKLNLLFGRNILTTYAELPNNNYITDIKTVISPGVMRTSGVNKYATAVEVSKEIEKEGYDINTAILKNSDSFVDGVPGIVLGFKAVAPIFPTKVDSLSSEVRNELLRLDIMEVIILGGEGAISSNVASELTDLGINVKRMSGSDRYETSVNIAKEVIDENTDSVIIATGSSYPDALSISPIGAKNQTPIIYTRTDYLPDSVIQFLNDNPNITNFTIAGGTGAVSQEVETQLESIGSVYRIYGLDRYGTGVNINKDFFVSERSVVLASNDIDGIPAALLSTLKGSQFLLTRSSSLPSSVDSHLYMLTYDKLIDNFYLIGGTGAISSEIENHIKSLIQ